jgi:hypothetical protein
VAVRTTRPAGLIVQRAGGTTSGRSRSRRIDVPRATPDATDRNAQAATIIKTVGNMVLFSFPGSHREKRETS